MKKMYPLAPYFVASCVLCFLLAITEAKAGDLVIVNVDETRGCSSGSDIDPVVFLKCMLKTPWCGSGIDILDANLEVDGVSTVVSSTKVLFRRGKGGGNDVLTGGGDDEVVFFVLRNKKNSLVDD
jgi:hypothetical protein